MMQYHKDLTLEKWSKLPKQAQIMNIGAEVSRAQNWQNLKEGAKVKECMERALELLDLTLEDKRWEEKLGDLLRIREGLAAFYVSDSAPIIYQVYLDWLTQFAQSN
jgi:hypothetical protein